MSQATELIARQMAAGASIGKIWGTLIYNVKDTAYGATGLGVQDDTAALVNTVAAASVNGGTVVFPPGTYKTGNFTVPANVTLWFMNGAKLSINSGATVTINGPIDAGMYQIFSGSGTVGGTPLVDKYFPQWWGAKFDLVNDDTLPIQAAFNTCGVAGGGTIFLLKEAKITNAINILYSNITIEGEGKLSKIITNHSTADIFTVGDGVNPIINITFRDLCLDASVSKTAGYGINFRFAARCKVEGVWFTAIEDLVNAGIAIPRMKHGIYFDRFDYCRVEACQIHVSGTGIACRGNADQSFGVALFLGGGTKIYCACVSGATGSRGVHIGGGVGGVNFDDIDIIDCENSVYIAADLTAAANREVFFSPNCSLDSAGYANIFVAANGLVHLDISGTWIASSGATIASGPGINIDPSAAPGMITKISGSRFFNNRGGGVTFNGGSFSITGCVFKSNGQGTGGGHGIWVANDLCTDFDISGNTIVNNGTAANGRGIYIQPTTTNNYMITNNLVRNNAQAQITDLGAANKVVANNLTT